MRPQDAPFRDKTHGGSAGLPIEIVGVAGREQGSRVERIGSDGRPEAAANRKVRLESRFLAVWQRTVHPGLRERHDSSMAWHCATT